MTPARGLIPVLALTLASACSDRERPAATLSVTQTLAGEDTAGYARVAEPRPFVFPRDHGPHPEYRHEWWYYTGNLNGGHGDIGFQLTFFRSVLSPDPPELDSEWSARQAFMAHFALTDVAGSGFRAYERFDRDALGLAGATTSPFRVWLGDWVAEEIGPSSVPGTPAVRLRASAADAAMDLRLDPAGPPVPQGVDGYSAKGPEPGNASLYYSVPWIRAHGTVRVGDVTQEVDGWAWLDREWGTSALGPELAGWDWFSLQLDDGTALMFYRLRREDGSTDRFSAGSVVEADGHVERLAADDVAFEVLDHWTSAQGTRYPSAWRLRIARLDLSIEVRPRVPDQELDLTFRYWEGAVGATGLRGGRPVAGRGYVELTGYADDPST